MLLRQHEEATRELELRQLQAVPRTRAEAHPPAAPDGLGNQLEYNKRREQEFAAEAHAAQVRQQPKSLKVRAGQRPRASPLPVPGAVGPQHRRPREDGPAHLARRAVPAKDAGRGGGSSSREEGSGEEGAVGQRSRGYWGRVRDR